MRFLFLLLTSLSFTLFPLSTQAQTDELPDTLRVGIKTSPPFVYMNESGRMEGISVQLWEELAAETGLAYVYEQRNLAQIIEGLGRGELDLSINPLTVTSERLKTLDFTQPFYISHLAIATRVRPSSTLWQTVKNLFSWNFLKVVGLLFLVILIFGVLAWAFERRQNPEEFQPGVRGVWSGIWWSAVTMTTVGYGDKSPQSLGGRIVALVWMFTAIIIISGFTAGIASSLTVNQLDTGITGLKDLKRAEVGTVTASASAQFLDRQRIAFEGFEGLSSALEALEKEELDALVYDEPILRYELLRGDFDGLHVLPASFNIQYYAFAVPRGSALADSLNPPLLEHIRDLRWKTMLEQYELDGE